MSESQVVNTYRIFDIVREAIDKDGPLNGEYRNQEGVPNSRESVLVQKCHHKSAHEWNVSRACGGIID